MSYLSFSSILYTEVYESRAGKGLDGKVGKIVGAGDTTNVDSAIFGMLADIVKMNINVFAASVVGGIIGEGKCTVVVTEKKGGARLEEAQFVEKKAEPDSFAAGLADSDILSVAGGAGNSLLLVEVSNAIRWATTKTNKGNIYRLASVSSRGKRMAYSTTGRWAAAMHGKSEFKILSSFNILTLETRLIVNRSSRLQSIPRSI